MKKILQDDEGITLILTVVIISIIVALTLQFNRSMWAELHSADNLKNSVKLGCIAKSGSNFALAVLEEDAFSNDSDSMHDIWAEAEEYSIYSTTLFEDGGFVVKIKDLSGRIQINQLIKLDNEEYVFNPLQKEIITRLLESEEFELESDDIDGMLDAIKDWIDPDDIITGFGGAESFYYESLENPYKCRNAPLESIEELILIKGITRELFYGSEDRRGLSEFLTVFGEGKININTASSLVIASLSEDIDPEMVDEIIAYRENEENDLSSIGWYKAALNTNEDYIASELITTASSYFDVESRGTIGARTKIIDIVVERKNKIPNILTWKYL